MPLLFINFKLARSRKGGGFATWRWILKLDQTARSKTLILQTITRKKHDNSEEDKAQVLLFHQEADHGCC